MVKERARAKERIVSRLSKPTNRTLFCMTGFLSACGSELCSFPAHSLTHGQRIGAGHSILTNFVSTFPKLYT